MFILERILVQSKVDGNAHLTISGNNSNILFRINRMKFVLLLPFNVFKTIYTYEVI